MDDHTQAFKLFRLLTKKTWQHNREWYYLGPPLTSYQRGSTDHHYLREISSLQETLEQGENLIHLGDEELIDRFNRIVNLMPEHDELELITVTKSIKHEVTPLPHEAVLERRRRDALKKLSVAEIQALGLEKLASYSKLKFHGEKKTK